MKTISFWAGVIMPLWDIPLMVRMYKRKSSQDISIVWAVGLWVSSVLMTPSSFIAKDMLAIGFNVMNVLMLTGVMIMVIKYRNGPSSPTAKDR